MSLSDINLSNYDNVIAVTQLSINETMAEYLNALSMDVALYYTTDEDGNLVPTDSKNAYYTFTGTLDYNTDENGNPINIINLYTDRGNQTVQYNITFSNAEFKSTVPGMSWDITQEAGEPWIIEYYVDLGMVGTDLDSLPPDVQAKVDGYVNNYGAGMFSIQQLFLDLNTAVFDTMTEITGMTDIPMGVFTAMMNEYMESLQATGGVIFGYTVTFSDQNYTPPTFAPTYMGFCVTPYTDADGNPTNHDLDTLNYLVMTDHHTAPAYPPQSFPFNFVDSDSENGALAFKMDMFRDFVLDSLSPMLTGISPNVHVEADGSKPLDEQVIELQPSSSSYSFTVVDPPQNGEVGTYSYQDSDSASDHGWSYQWTMDNSCSYWSNANITFEDNKVHISGYVATEASIINQFNTGHGSTSEYDMPKTTYNWSVDLVLQFDNSNNGVLKMVVENENFDSDPVVENEPDPSWWETFLDSIAGYFQSYVDDMGDLRGQIQTSIIDNILPDINSGLANANAFVFPGNDTFTFSNPQFSDSLDLASNVNYLTPEA